MRVYYASAAGKKKRRSGSSTLAGALRWILAIAATLLVAAAGAIASVIGVFFIKLGKSRKIMNALYKGVIATSLVAAALFYFFTVWNGTTGPGIFLASLVGIAVTIIIGLVTEYYTAKEHRPVREIAESAKTGAGTVLIQGLAVGMESTALPMLTIVVAIAVSYWFAGLYGIAIAATAMLSLTGIIIALDSYGPITDNAGGIAEMSGLPSSVREVTDKLDSVGNTTKATTKGFAIAGAALGALALFAAFAEETGLQTINLLDPAVTIGLFIGALLPFVFASLLMKAVGRAAFDIVEEVRRQFRTIKGLMAGKARADYAKCVDISTAGALRELLVPGVLAVFSPLVVGFLFGAEALGGLLAGVIVSGFLLARSGNIEEAAQYNDNDTGLFFMRVQFACGEHSFDELKAQLADFAEPFQMQWQLHALAQKMRTVIMVSKEGHCLNDLLFRWKSGLLPVDICAIISNHREFYQLAASYNVPFHHLPVTAATKAQVEAKQIEIIESEGAELVVLARYMQILSDDLCRKLSGRAINIHHSFLPSFKGAKPYYQAHDRGVKLIGATAHYVTAELDEGPIIAQAVVPVLPDDTPDTLATRILEQEHVLYPLAVRLIAEGRVRVTAETVRIDGHQPPQGALINPAP